MPYANDNGVKLWYDANGTGEPLVVSGGFGLLHDQFAHIRDLLTPHLQVIDWHYRGAGLSDRAWPGGYPFDRWVDDLGVILDQVGLDAVHLWGTSTGAPLNVRFAARYPERVKSLITYPGVSFTPESRHMFQVFQDVTETFGYEALGRLTQWIGCAEHNVFGDRANEIALFEIESFKRNFSIPSLAKTLEVFAHCDLSADVAKLTMPVLVFMGNSGHLGAATPGQTAAIEAFTALCPHAEVRLIENGGGTYHMIEQPEQTASVVIDFVRSQAGV